MPIIPEPGEQAASAVDDRGRELALFRAVLDAVDDAVLVTGPEIEPPGPVIEYANPAVARMTGYTPVELLGQTPRLLQGPKTDRAVLDRLRADLRRMRRFQGEVVNYRKDGSEYLVEWLIVPLLGDGDRVLHWVSVQHDVTEQRRMEARQLSLLGELNHRVKNTLSTVQAIANLTLRSSVSPQSFAEGFQSRLRALSGVHNLLNRSAWAGGSLRELLLAELGPHSGGNPDRCLLEGEEVWLSPRVALALSLAFHELAANAIQHGALSDDHGRVEVRWRLTGGPAGQALELTWNERGGPRVGLAPHAGFGSHFLTHGLSYELQGQVQLRLDPEGVSCSIHVLLPIADGETKPQVEELPFMVGD
jgi:PAS domain S-box-containing protein